MITAVDTNIFLNILIGTALEGIQARDAIFRVAADGNVICSIVCYAELACHFPDQQNLDRFLQTCFCEIVPPSPESAFLAGRFHREYLKRGGKRTRVLADFFVAADAQLNADRLLTRDSRFFGSEFPNLVAIDPVTLLKS